MKALWYYNIIYKEDDWVIILPTGGTYKSEGTHITIALKLIRKQHRIRFVF